MGTCSGKKEKIDIDPNYNTLIKTGEQKDGLELFKTKEYISSIHQIRCPIIKDKLSYEENTQLETQINNADKNIIELFDKYNNLINNIYKVDIFSELEFLNNEIESGKKKLEENRYFLHNCKEQQIYLDISIFDKDYNFNNRIIDKRYIFDNWKNNNLNAKNELLRERKICYLKRKEQDEIEKREREIQYEKERKEREIRQKKEDEKRRLMEKYRKDFDDYCKEKESSSYQMAKMDIDQQVSNLDLINMDINEKRNKAEYLYNRNASILNYSINRNRLKDYLQNIFGYKPNDNIIDDHDILEKNAFEFFISSREKI